MIMYNSRDGIELSGFQWRINTFTILVQQSAKKPFLTEKEEGEGEENEESFAREESCEY